MAFRKKTTIILEELPDVLIIQECESLEKLLFDKWFQIPSDKFWYGYNVNKGIGVFTFNGYKIHPLDHNTDHQYILPLLICKENWQINLFAVWTQKTHDGHYTRQIWNAVNYYADLLDKNDSFILGDLNSSAIWDKPKRISNHTNLVTFLEQKAIYSTYHYFYKEQQGKELKPTLFFQKNKNKPFHIDFCFVSSSHLKYLLNIAVGEYDKWIKYSDHMPLIVDFELRSEK